MSIHIFGIRHHGPGCARSLAQALAQLQPDILLIEGPPEADDLLTLAAHDQMKPPVALLVYAPAMPKHAAYYPFAEFSPEWQAILYGQAHQIPTRFIDLPQTHQFAADMVLEAAEALALEGDEKTVAEPDSTLNSDIENDVADKHVDTSENPEKVAKPIRSGDALAWLAEAAGFSDSETWWDHLIEQRQDSLDLFDAIEEMMTVARTELTDHLTPHEAQREAHMRQMIRLTTKQGYQRIAVVCGAWHVPALRTMPTAKYDNDLLKNLPKTKVAATWTPWSYGRLTSASGYGAGVQAPGWYHHVWSTPEKAALYWLTDVARLLRKHDLDASSAHIIEVLRLSETLASLRDRSRAGLQELLEATQSVLFGESHAPMQLIEKDLLIHDRLGQVPPETPMLPLSQDVKQLQKRYRLQIQTDAVTLELDLRQNAHLEKSIFLHRLHLLGIPWGKVQTVRGKQGSFHEVWLLQWQPEFELKLIEANVWGATVAIACHARLCDLANNAQRLPELTKLVERMLLADLRTAIPIVMACMQTLAASTHDAGILLVALPPLANVLRYGNVRKSNIDGIAQVLAGLLIRACIALPQAASHINTEAAQILLTQIVQADSAIHLLQNDEYTHAWFDALQCCTSQHGIQALIAGRAVRILTEHNLWSIEQAAQALSLACSNPVNPLATADWLAGFLQGSGMLLVLNDALWHIVNDWISSLSESTFHELLPLLRRTLATFTAPERQQLGQRAAHGGTHRAVQNRGAPNIHAQRAALMMPTLHLLFAPIVPSISSESHP